MINIPYLSNTSDKVIPVIKLHGTIAEGEDNINIHSKKEEIDKAFEHATIAVFVSINSPGGLPTQSALVHDYIRRKADAKGVKVFVFIEDFGASGGYWLACMGDAVACTPTSLVGSIGVISGGFGFTELMYKHGIERRLFTAGERKAPGDPFSVMTAEDKEYMENMVESLHKVFIDHVKSRRPQVDESLFDAKVVIGVDAIELGLVDKLTDMYEARDKEWPEYSSRQS